MGALLGRSPLLLGALPAQQTLTKKGPSQALLYSSYMKQFTPAPSSLLRNDTSLWPSLWKLGTEGADDPFTTLGVPITQLQHSAHCQPVSFSLSCINLYKVHYDVQENEVAVDAVF